MLKVDLYFRQWKAALLTGRNADQIYVIEWHTASVTLEDVTITKSYSSGRLLLS